MKSHIRTVEDVNNLLTELRLQIRSLKDQLAEVENYEKMINEMNGSTEPRDAVKALIENVIRSLSVSPDDVSFPQILRPAGFSGKHKLRIR